jgi:hypothetical protein
VADGDLAGTHIAGETSESQASAYIPAQVDNQAIAVLRFKIANAFCSISYQIARLRERPRSFVSPCKKQTVLGMWQ